MSHGGMKGLRAMAGMRAMKGMIDKIITMEKVAGILYGKAAGAPSKAAVSSATYGARRHLRARF